MNDPVRDHGDAPRRQYVCPMCGFDGLRAGPVTATVDVNWQWGCPTCMRAGRIVWLVETTDPRTAA